MINQATTSETNGAEALAKKTVNNLETKTVNNSDATSIAEAIEQMKLAAASVYEAVGTLKGASTNAAKAKLGESKVKAQGIEAQAEAAIAEKPLLYIGAAFAAGWLVSKLMKS